MCYLCLRTCVTHVSGLYTLEREDYGVVSQPRRRLTGVARLVILGTCGLWKSERGTLEPNRIPKIVSHGGWWHYDSGYGRRRFRRSLLTRNKREAERIKSMLDRRLRENRLGIDSPKVSICDFYSRYSEYTTTNKAPKTARTDLAALVELMTYFGGGVALAHIETEALEAWKTKRIRSGISALSVNSERSHLQSAFQTAVLWGMLKDNPFKRVKKLRIDQKAPRYLSNAEIAKTFEYIDAATQPFIMLSLCTGMRLGEITNLHWADVDLDRRTIRVTNQGTFRTKSHKERYIPIHDQLHAILVDLPKTGLTLWPLKADTLYRRLKRAVCKAGLPDDITFHTLRHTFATRLVQLGQPLAHIQTAMGHSTISVTEGYAHRDQLLIAPTISVLDFRLDAQNDKSTAR